MATREIKTRFKLEGEQKFRQAMNDAAASIKVLNSEQKLAEAQYKATGDEQQYAAAQARILKEQIEQQKQAVAAAEQAVKRLTEDGIDPNAKIMQTWRTKLNNANRNLLSMQTRLDNLGGELSEETEGFGNAKEAAGDFNDEMEEVAKGVDLQATVEGIGNIASGLWNVVKVAARAAKAVWEMGVDAGAWADDIKTAADQLDVDAETYQSWRYASRFIDTSVDDIARSWQDIDNKMQQSGDSVYKYMEQMAEYGIAVQDELTGETRQGKDIFWDAVDYLHNIGDEGERSAKAMQMFGNDWRRLNPLISAGSQAYKELAEEGMSVAVVSNEHIEALGSVDDSVQKLDASLDKLKYDALAALAPTLETAANAMSEAVTAFDEFIQSEEGQAALADLNESLQGIVTWISEHGDEVMGFIGGVGEKLGGLMEFFGFPGMSMTAKEAEQAYAALSGMMGGELADDILACQEALTKNPGGAEQGLYALLMELAGNQDVLDNLGDSTRSLLEAWNNPGNDFGLGGVNQFADSQTMLNLIIADMQNAFDKAKEGGANIPAGYAQGISEGADEPATAAGDMAEDSIAAAEAALDSHSPSRVFTSIGENVAVGMANGIYARGDEAIAAAQWMAQSVTDIVQSALQIHSPSKVFERMGQFAGLGFAEGIEVSTAEVTRAVDAMMSATARRPAMTIAGTVVESRAASGTRSGSAASAGETGSVQVTLMIDGEVLGTVMAPIVNDKIGAKIQATRR